MLHGFAVDAERLGRKGLGLIVRAGLSRERLRDEHGGFRIGCCLSFGQNIVVACGEQHVSA